MSPNHDAARTEALLAQAIEKNAAKIDRFFAGLFLVEWASRIALAYVHPTHDDDLITAIFIGAFIASMPTMLVVWKPGIVATRHAIAVAQMLYGALLVHLTKGAYETHAHVFLSLTLLSLYRDPAIIVTAAAVAVLQLVGLTDPPAAAAWGMWIACSCPVLFCVARRGREDLRAIAAALAANRTNDSIRAEVIASMSQEIRQPMTAILGSADILLEDRQSVDPRSYVQRIRRNGQQLLDVIEEASDATKIVPIGRQNAAAPLPSRRLDCSVLLVEDDLDNQKILTDHLVRSGMSVAIASNGMVALAEVASASECGRPFDLVLMDMQLPVMDGYAATTELRKRGYGGPILALTARAMKGDRRRCLDAGCTEYLTKPITRERLVQAVANHALGSAPTLPPPATGTSDEPVYSASDEELGGEMQELLDGFVTRLRQNAAEAEAAAAAGNHVELARVAHRLRGAAGSFGFLSISDAAGVVEEAAQTGADTRESLTRLVSLCRRARTRNRLAEAA